MTRNPFNNNDFKGVAEMPPLLVLSWVLAVYNIEP